MKYLKSKPGSLEAAAGQVSGFATEQEYQKMFKKELDKAGKGIGAMSPKEKKDFFNKIDAMYKAPNEKPEQKEELNKDDKKVVTKVKDMLKKASQAHAGQAKELDKAMKTEADTKGNEINQGKMDRVKKGEKDLVDPKPSLKSVAKTVKEMMRKKKDDVATMADTEKDKEKKTTLVGSKKTSVDTKPEIEYKN